MSIDLTKYPKVSIQIPTYNQEKFIQKTIESCLMQDYPNLEINIADDHSSDNTPIIIEKYIEDSRIRYFRNVHNIGRVANYHKALFEYASGEWAINLDGDDHFIDNSFISKAIERINRVNDEKVLVYQANHDIAKLRELFPLAKPIDESTIMIAGTSYFLNYFKVLNFHHCATLYNRTKAVHLNFYTYNCLFTDFNSIARLFIDSNILFSSDNVAVWHQHGNNESLNFNEEIINNEMQAINDLADFAAKKLPSKKVKKNCTKIKIFMLGNYIDMINSGKLNRIVLKLLLFNFNFSFIYFKQLTKALIGSLGLKKVSRT